MNKTWTISIYDAETDELKRERTVECTFEQMVIRAENMTSYDEYWLWS